MNKKIIISLLAILILVIVGLALVIKKHQSKELKDVLESPMANLQIVAGEEIKRSYHDRGTTLGKPVYVTLHIQYQPKDNNTEIDVFNELVKNMKQVINNSDEIVFDGEHDSESINKISNGDIYIASFSYKTHLRLDVSVYGLSNKNAALVNIKNYSRYPGHDFLMTIKNVLNI